MEQDRFDDLAKKVFDSSSRRRVLGGALASLVGAGVATVAGVDAKNKGKGKAKKGKGKAKGEFTCTAGNANDPLQGGCNAQECCQSTPAGNNATCVGIFAQLNTQTCGDNTGQGVCRTCPTGTKCGIRNGALVCICDSSTCATGCCIPGAAVGDDEVCVQNGSGAPVNSSNPDFDGSFVCGTAGSICNVCSVGTLFAGCCTATGACSAGTSNANCGSNGELCETCQNDSSCGIDQACTGGTTTTTAAPTTTTAAPCGFTKGGNPKVTCGTACCGPKRGCNGAGTKCGKK